MRPPIRVVCHECLQSLEYSTSEGSSSSNTSCPYCGCPVDLSRAGTDPSSSQGLPFPISSDSPATLDHHPEATPRVDAAAKLPPTQVDRFIIREPLGEGGYGQVYRAYDPHLDRDVALKVLKPTRLGEKALERFFREARAAARLDHPNIVALYDAGRDEARCWIAYQLVFGRTLSLVRDLDRPSVDASARIIRELAQALDHAHGRGVFHRDLKPANVLIDDSGRPRLTDFGLARRENVDSDLTREGTVLGTPHYMSPEAAAGRAHLADARSDVYSLGVILYELICGRKPSDAPSVVTPWRPTRFAVPPTPSSVVRAIPAALDRICMKALAFDPNDRYPDARGLADALSHYLHSRPDPDATRPRRPAGPRRYRMASLGVVAASALCLALGMSLRVPSVGQVHVAGMGINLPAAGEAEKAVRQDKLKPVFDVEKRPATPTQAPLKPFIGGKSPGKYHTRKCRSKPRNNVVEYASIEEAEARGLLPCQLCRPDSTSK